MWSDIFGSKARRLYVRVGDRMYGCKDRYTTIIIYFLKIIKLFIFDMFDGTAGQSPRKRNCPTENRTSGYISI